LADYGRLSGPPMLADAGHTSHPAPAPAHTKHQGNAWCIACVIAQANDLLCSPHGLSSTTEARQVYNQTGLASRPRARALPIPAPRYFRAQPNRPSRHQSAKIHYSRFILKSNHIFEKTNCYNMLSRNTLSRVRASKSQKQWA
jgi:hypothetical protein